MAPKRKNIAASLQAGAFGASQNTNTESPPPGRQKRQRREGTRSGFRKELSPSSPPLLLTKLLMKRSQKRLRPTLLLKKSDLQTLDSKLKSQRQSGIRPSITRIRC